MSKDVKDKDDSKVKEILGHIVKNNLLKGKCLRLYEFILTHKQASYRDIQKYMMSYNCIVFDHINDLVAWGAIKQTGITLHKENGTACPVYQVTGKMPVVPELVDYEDIID
jgi:hypothetical protein